MLSKWFRPFGSYQRESQLSLQRMSPRLRRLNNFTTSGCLWTWTNTQGCSPHSINCSSISWSRATRTWTRTGCKRPWWDKTWRKRPALGLKKPWLGKRIMRPRPENSCLFQFRSKKKMTPKNMRESHQDRSMIKSVMTIKIIQLSNWSKTLQRMSKQKYWVIWLREEGLRMGRKLCHIMMREHWVQNLTNLTSHR